jgi:signal peptidase complex subunit 2
MGRKNSTKQSSEKAGSKIMEVEAKLVEPEDEDNNNEEEEEEEEDDDEEEIELLQVDVGDMIKLKQILDETVAATVLEKIDEDYVLDNIKLAIMTIACGFAMVAQFAPLPFPESRPIMGLCCICYFLLSGVLQLITTFVDQDSILLTRPLAKDGSSGAGDSMTKTNPNDVKNADLFKYGVRVRSQFPRFSEFYTVILEFQGYDGTPSVQQTWSVGQFFDKEGMFDEIGLQLEVERLYHRLEDGDYDTKTTADKKKD